MISNSASAAASLALLERAGRLTGPFDSLRSLRAGAGSRRRFSVGASQRVAAGEVARLERLARYATRVPLAVGAVRDRAGGKVEIDTPSDPRTGARVKVLDRLDFIHAVCQQIADPKLHQTRHDGAYSSRKRRGLREAMAELAGTAVVEEEAGLDDVLAMRSTDAPPPVPPGSAEARRRQSWAKMLREVFDPRVCKRCGEEVVIVAWIAKTAVIDCILRHRQKKGVASSFEP